MDIELVKDIRQKHCIGCRNNAIVKNNHICGNRAVIDCWLRKTYLPDGIYNQATEADTVASMSNSVADEINQMIIDKCFKKINKSKSGVSQLMKMQESRADYRAAEQKGVA